MSTTNAGDATADASKLAAEKAAADKAAADKVIADKAAADTAAAAKVAADKKAADEKAAADLKAETERKAGEKPKAPEKYDLKTPDGGRLDAADLALVETEARKYGLTNEQAQALVDDHDTRLAAQATAFEAAAKADKDYGGDKLAESQALAKAAIDRLRPAGHPRRDAFLRFLNKGGAGNHVEVIAILADLGKLMREDTGLGGRKVGGGAESPLDKMYPSMK